MRGLAIIVPFAILLFLVALRPLGYTGGGDQHPYLAAARCAAEHGFCVPDSHWAARMALVVPLGRAIAWFGESRISLAAVTLGYAVASLALFLVLVRDAFGPRAGVVAASVLAVTPIFFLRATMPAVELAELAWVLGACRLLQVAIRHSRATPALLAGVAAAVALLARETAIVTFAVSAIAILGLCGGRAVRAFVLAAIGGGAALVVVAVAYRTWTGDPFLPWRLAMGHGAVPSTQLATPLAAGRLPFFNPDLIAHWRRPMGIEVHWSLDGLLNLMANPEIGLTLLVGAVFVILTYPRIRGDARLARAAGMAGLASILHFSLLAFGLAIDPLPRMFLFEAAIAAALTGVLAALYWAEGKRLAPLAGAVLLAVKAVVAPFAVPSIRVAEPVLRQWAATVPGIFALETGTRKAMALDPMLGAAAMRPDTRTILAVMNGSCAERPDEHPDFALAEQQQLHQREPMPIALLRERRILLGPQPGAYACRFTRADRAASPLR
jgi:hypothetical protein